MTYINGITRRAVLLGVGVGVGTRSFASTVEAKRFGVRGDGSVDDGPALQKALLSGEHVRLPAGIYRLDDFVLVPPSGSRISGEPGRTILAKKARGSASYTNPFFDILDVSDVTIEGLTFEEAAGEMREYAIMVRASSLGGTRRIKILNNTFKNAATHVERYVDGLWFEGNKILGQDNGAIHGIAVGGVLRAVGAANDGLCANIFIRGNYFEKTRTEAIDINWHTHYVTITDNICIDCDVSSPEGEIGDVIDVGGGANGGSPNYCRYVTIANNIIYSPNISREHSGIQIKQWTRDFTITGNVVHGLNDFAGSVGIKLSNAYDGTITGNIVTGFGNGILAISSCRGITIGNNSLSPLNRDGIQIAGGSDFTITGNILSTSSASLAGIEVAGGASNFTISNNQVRGWRRMGIYVQPRSNLGRLANNIIIGATTKVVNFGTDVSVDGVYTLAIAHNAAASITPPRTSGTVSIVAEGTSGIGLIAFFRVGELPALSKWAGGVAGVAGSGALTGTTGADGNLTASAHVDGRLYIENRTGASRTVAIRFASEL